MANGIRLVALSEKAAEPIHEAELPLPMCLVLGDEEQGDFIRSLPQVRDAGPIAHGREDRKSECFSRCWHRFIPYCLVENP